MFAVCEHLQPLLESELKAGNEIEEIHADAFERSALFAMLKRPFSRSYSASELGNVRLTMMEDPHYPMGKAYRCDEHEHDLFAPMRSG